MEHQDLSLSARYQAAALEINARIRGRDHIILTFMTLSVAILGISVATPELAFTLYLLLTVPYIALITTQLFSAHEFLLGFLTAHLGDISKAAGPVPEWDWHVGPKYVKKVLQRGGFVYLAHIWAMSTLCSLALVISSRPHAPAG